MSARTHFVDSSLSVARADVLHFLGYPEGHEPRPRIADLLDECLAEARGLVRGRGVWTTLDPDEAPAIGLEPVAAKGLVIGLVTAGAAIVAAASARMERGDATGALLLDACGSAAAEEAADRISAAIVAALSAGAGSAGVAAIATGTANTANTADTADSSAVDAEGPARVSCRISPGYGGWQLASQEALFARLPHRAIGVRLEHSLLMVPRKSVSFAMWLGADARPLAGLSGCARCELESCRYRREPRTLEDAAV
jgi:hypothetical protein